MERFANKLASSLPALILRGAGEIHRRPAVAAGLYAAALMGVFASPFAGVRHPPGISGRSEGRGLRAQSSSEPPRASVFDELEGAGLRMVERSHRLATRCTPPGTPRTRSTSCSRAW